LKKSRRSLSHFSVVVPCVTAKDVFASTVAAGEPRQTGCERGCSIRTLRSAAEASERMTARLPPAKVGIENETSCLLLDVSTMGAQSKSTSPDWTDRRLLSNETSVQSGVSPCSASCFSKLAVMRWHSVTA
jgi:hypothetical protein